MAKTLETPADLAMKAEQQRVRMEQGEALKHPVEQDPKVYAESFTFRLRQWKNTNFAGLWELSVLDKKGATLEIVTDADALTNCLESIGSILENRGF